MRDDYEYALEGIAVDYVTNPPRSDAISRIRKDRRRLKHPQYANNNPYPYDLSSLSSSSLSSSLSSLLSSPSSTKNTIIYQHKSLTYG